jgi:hypothetical protein
MAKNDERKGSAIHILSDTKEREQNRFVVFVMATPTLPCMFQALRTCSHDSSERLYDLRQIESSLKYFPGARNAIEVLLLRADMFFQGHFDLRQSYVCSKHKDEFLREFRISTQKKKCLLCVPCFKKPSSAVAVRYINAAQAITIFDRFQFRHSYAQLVCDSCRKSVGRMADHVSEMLLAENQIN